MAADLETVSVVSAVSWVVGSNTPWLFDKAFGPFVEERMAWLYRRSKQRKPLVERLLVELHQIKDESERLIILLDRTIDERDHLQHELYRARRQLQETRSLLSAKRASVKSVKASSRRSSAIGQPAPPPQKNPG